MRGQSTADQIKEQELRTPPEQTGQQDPTDPEVSYMTSDQGPFACSNCTSFTDPNSCSKVSGEIDPEGVCKLFSSLNSGNQAPEMTQGQT